MEKSTQSEVTSQYARAIKKYRAGNFTDSREMFLKLVEKFSGIDDYSIQPVVVMAKANISMIDAKETKIKPKLKTPEDKLNQGIYCLNSGDFDEALILFNDLIKKDFNKPFIYYLMSIAYLKIDEVDNSIDHLKKSIKLDEYYRILAFNESDFEPLADNENFINLVHIINSE